MMRTFVCPLFFFATYLLDRTGAFAPKVPNYSSANNQNRGWILRARTKESAITLTDPEEKVYGLLEEIHDSKLDFRVVVVGNGAILESTSTLGPKMKLSQSPATGENLVTFASEDNAFEFHVKLAQVSKVTLVEKESPANGRTMRILRFVNEVGKPVCSLIVAEDSDASVEWYNTITTKYGSEIQL